jgi:hypothetical protein
MRWLPSLVLSPVRPEHDLSNEVIREMTPVYSHNPAWNYPT